VIEYFGKVQGEPMILDGSNTLPDRTIAPNLIVSGVEEAVRFYQNAFGAELVLRKEQADGSLQHAKLRIGASFLIISEEVRGGGGTTRSPNSLGGTSASFELFVDNFDAAIERALLAGGKPLAPLPRDSFFGDTAGMIVDPFGHVWALSTFLDDSGALCI
jgi:PhnB protein